MTCASLASAITAAPATPAKRRLSPRAAFYLQASMTLSFLAGSSAPTPLYAVYQAQWGFSSTMLTLAFGVYALAVLAALLVVGRLSDHIGRRPVLMAAAAAQVLAMAVFATADGLNDVLIARVIQGLSAGAAVAAVGAGLLDIDRLRAATANSVAPLMGTALGGVVAALMMQYLPAPTHLVFAVLGVIFVLQGVAVFFIAETATPKPGALVSLRPQVALPAALRRPMLAVVPAVVAVWSLAGFYASLGPTLVRSLMGPGSVVWGGAALFVLAGSGALAVALLQQRSPGWLMRVGASALFVGVALVLLALSERSITLFFLATAVAGVGFGAGFQGALRSLVALIAPHERAGVLSVLFIVSYLALGVPAIAAGYGLALQGDILLTAREFGVAVMALAFLALCATVRAQRPQALPAR